MTTASQERVKGEKPTRENVVRIFGNLTRRVAHRFHRHDRRLDFDDLYQVGLITLFRCLEKYDPERKINPDTGRGYSFRAYVGFALHSEMKRYATKSAKQGITDIPDYEKDSVLPRVTTSFLGIQYDDHKYETVGARPDEDNNLSVLDDGPEIVANDEVWTIAQRVLTHREYWVLWSVFGMGETDAQVARWLGVSRVLVGYIRKDALDKLRPHVQEFA